MPKYLLFFSFIALAIVMLFIIFYLIKNYKSKAEELNATDEIDESLFETINLSINDINNYQDTPANKEPLYNKDDIVYTDDKTVEIKIDSTNF